ncbi:MAG: hypothetical protein JNL12_03725 [Planctomycetes bacterium]|nr:hypothetical protein [Planctomycetota bacterium]
MNPLKRTLLVAATTFAVTACSTAGSASPPSLDHQEGAASPVFQPMLVVPLPSLLGDGQAAGRPMDALQARATPLGDVLLALFKDSDINLVVDPAVQAMPCTFDIKRSTVEESFESLLESLDLGYEWDGNFLRVQNMVRDTVLVDLMDASAGGAQGGGQGGGTQGGGSQGGSGAQGGGGGFWDEIEESLPSVLGEGASFVVNRTGSAIHVEARPSGVRRLREIVGTTMDRANKQVSLEARVLEVRLENEYSLGINWSLLPGLFNSNKTGLAGGGAVIGQTAASGGTALTFGILDNADFSLVVDALQLQGQVRVLSSPRVSTLNNQSAAIQVTDQVPYIRREIVTQEGIARTEYSVEFVQTGVILNVRPLIGEDGLLSVSITPSVREQIGTVVTPDGFVTVPVLSERQATTTVRVADGQAIALGGLRSTRKSESRQGIPFLMDVPWLGQVFSNTVQERNEVELMIVLVPRVLDDTWISEEVERGAHRLVQLRRGFQWNPIRLEGVRAEDWSGGSLQGRAQAAGSADVRVPDQAPVPMPPDRGTTVTRKGLAAQWLARAERALSQGDPTIALQAIEKSLALEPTRREALVAGGLLHERHGDRARARVLLDRAIEQGDDVVALTARGANELTSGSAWSARRYFERAHELGKTTLTGANLAASLIVLGMNDEARVLLRSIAAPAAPPELHANLAFVELKCGSAAAARDSLLRALAAGADARNPRLVALERMVADAEHAAELAAKP